MQSQSGLSYYPNLREIYFTNAFHTAVLQMNEIRVQRGQNFSGRRLKIYDLFFLSSIVMEMCFFLPSFKKTFYLLFFLFSKIFSKKHDLKKILIYLENVL